MLMAKKQTTDSEARKQFTMRFDPALFAAINLFIEDQRFKPDITSVIERYVQEGLERDGFWPPPAAKSK
jgi:hypothetical protein